MKIEVLVSALTLSLPSALLDPPLTTHTHTHFFPPFHFAEKVSSSSPMPRWCPGKVRAESLPISPPGQRAPSHMPCRLARSSASLNWLIATQRKRKKTLPHCCQSSICLRVRKHGAHQRNIFTYTSLHPHQDIHTISWMPPHALLLPLPYPTCLSLCSL